MNARRLTMVAVVLSVGSFTLGGPALAQEAAGRWRSEHVNCYKVVGEARDTWPGAGNVSTGVIARSGLLNGTTQYVYDTEGFPTPDPNVVTFGAALTLTTKRGIVAARVLFLFDVATGIVDVDRHDRSQFEHREVRRSDRDTLVPLRHDHQSGWRRAGLPVVRHRPSVPRQIGDVNANGTQPSSLGRFVPFNRVQLSQPIGRS